MRSFTQYSKGLFAAGILAASLASISGCWPDYALFRIHVKSSPKSTIPAPNGSDNTAINQCEMTITDQDTKVVLNHFILKKVSSVDSAGNSKLTGCEGGLTPIDIGLFSYSTSNTKGTFTFTVDGWDDNRTLILQTKTSDPITAQVYPPEMPEVVLTMAYDPNRTK